MIGSLRLSQDHVKIMLLAAFAAACLLAGFLADTFSVRTFAILFLAICGSILFILPYKWCIAIIMFYMGVEGALKILSNYHPVVHVGLDLLAAVVAGRWFVTSLLRRESVLKYRPPLLALLAVHLVWFVIEFFNPNTIGLYASLASAKLYVITVMFFIMGYYVTDSVKTIRIYFYTWLIIAAAQIITALIQSSIGPMSVLSISPYYAKPLSKFAGSGVFRPFGLTALPGNPAVFIALTAPMLFYFIAEAKEYSTRLFSLVLVPLAAVALFVCQIRSSIAKALLGSAFYFASKLVTGDVKNRIKFSLIAVGIAVAGASAVPFLVEQYGGTDQFETMMQRTESTFDIDTVKRSRGGAVHRITAYAMMVPLGAGLSRTGAAGKKFASSGDPVEGFTYFFTDNLWAALIVDLGIPGAIIVTLIIAAILMRGYSSTRMVSDPQLKAIAVTLMSALVPMVFGFWGSESLIYNPDAFFFWFFSGVLLRLPRIDRGLEA